jgi:hypothetical protein
MFTYIKWSMYNRAKKKLAAYESAETYLELNWKWAILHYKNEMRWGANLKICTRVIGSDVN